MNNNLKAKGNNLIKSSDGNFGSLYSYLCDSNRSIEDSLKQGFFDPVKTRLGAGDLISVVEIKKTEDGKDEYVSASIMLIVVACIGDKKILDIQPNDNLGIKRYKRKVNSSEEPEVGLDKKVYIDGDGQVEKNKVTGDWIVKCDGKVVLETTDSGLANAVARGDVPIPEKS